MAVAYFNKIGLVRLSVAELKRVPPIPASQLFVGGLSYVVDDQSLRDAFARFGFVYEARVVADRYTDRSKGFGFVSFSNPGVAVPARSAMDGQYLHGRKIRVSYAKYRGPPPPPSWS